MNIARMAGIEQVQNFIVTNDYDEVRESRANKIKMQSNIF